MEDITTPDEVAQRIGTKQEENIPNLRGFGKAKGKWAVIVVAILFTLLLLWRFLAG